MTTIFFVRHAETADTGHRLTGWTDGIGLTDAGREQAAAVARILSTVKFEAIYSSPIDRTLETARAIAQGHGVQVTTRAGIGEIHYGRWTNRSLKVLARTKLWQQVQRNPSSARFPEGETLREVQARAVEEVEDIHATHPKGRVCCVSHGDVIKLVLAHYIGAHIDLYQRIVIAPASFSVLSLSAYGPRVLALNNLAPPKVVS